MLFVDLYTPSLELYSKAAKPLTYDGLHLTEEGDKAISDVIAKALFPAAPAAKLDAAAIEKLRDGINDKNFYFFQHYDVLDGIATNVRVRRAALHGARLSLKSAASPTRR